MIQSEKFSQTLWQESSSLYRDILDHPFNRELARGTLPVAKFQFYIKQDALYLIDYARALALLAARAPMPHRLLDFMDFARDAIVVEKALHEEFFEHFGITADQPMAPSCFFYTNYLIATAANKSYQEAMAALLPCFWIYREVGLAIAREAASDNPYSRWIETYSGEEFALAVQKAIDIADEIAEHASEITRRQMLDAYIYSTRLEWMFWNGAYELETWKP